MVLCSFTVINFWIHFYSVLITSISFNLSCFWIFQIMYCCLLSDYRGIDILVCSLLNKVKFTKIAAMDILFSQTLELTMLLN